ncbi:MAG: hypothetical protein HY874_10905 [Chloroflexi bacterium]|nr:hypothetical protein [Chloroflexota bacterium]
MRLLVIGVLAWSVLGGASAACGGGSPPVATPTSETVVRRQADALLRSSAGVTAATSFAATFHADVEVNGNPVSEDGRMAFRADGTFYLQINVADQSIEVLVDLPEAYINVPGQGWYSMGEELLNGSAYAEYAKNRGLIDYASMVDSMKEPVQGADEPIDGKDHLHYSGAIDFTDAIDKIPEDVFKPGVTDLTRQLVGQPGRGEVWINPDTGLPRRLKVDMTVNFGGSVIPTSMVIDYVSWNEPVDIPALPQDAKPYSELTRGLTAADVAYALRCSNWLTVFAEHAAVLDELPDVFNTETTTEQRAAAEAFFDDFRADFAALRALGPTPAFQPSYDKFMSGMQQFEVAVDEMEKELHQGGSGDEAKSTTAAEAGTEFFTEAADLFRSEQPAEQ